jgi:prenyltransferase beta subunit
MKRMLLFAALAIVVAPLRADDDPGIKQSIAYVQKLQTSNGGFINMIPPANARLAPTLRATSAGVRALHYLGGAAPDKEAAVRFIERCWDEKSGGFADTPQGKTDVFTTAVAMLAVNTLKMPADKYGPGAVKYMAENAKGFEEIRIAAAGLESLNMKSARAKDWVEEVNKSRNADGSFGKGAGLARATGSSVVTILRLGGEVADRDGVIKILKAGQRANGGYGKEDNETASDMETTYRVLRCFVMLKARPDNVEGLRSFIAKCRNEDGGYGTAPGQPSSVNGVYFAAIMRYWLNKKE